MSAAITIESLLKLLSNGALPGPLSSDYEVLLLCPETLKCGGLYEVVKKVGVLLGAVVAPVDGRELHAFGWDEL
jgi:hypothetical protein